MAEFGINFHATPDEIAEWVRDWVETEGIHLVATYGEPFAVEDVKAEEIASVMADERVWRLSFLRNKPDVTMKYQGDFDDVHSDQMILILGRITDDGLNESWISCRTDNLEAYAVWKRVARSLKSKTKSGVTVFNEEYKACNHNTSRRYSVGAKALEDAGTEMIPIQGPGGPRLRLGLLSKEELHLDS